MNIIVYTQCIKIILYHLQVKNVADTHGIVLRVGCFCNPGACQAHLGHTDQELRKNQEVM